jgi:hypothetical protein
MSASYYSEQALMLRRLVQELQPDSADSKKLDSNDLFVAISYLRLAARKLEDIASRNTAAGSTGKSDGARA